MFLQLHQVFHKQQEELDCLEERNLHLKELASRAKHLALVLEVRTSAKYLKFLLQINTFDRNLCTIL